MSTGEFWQVGRSLAETNLRMLESQLGADITFDVGKDVTKEGSQKFQAHKYMMVSRSPVFETMFHGSLVETSNVIEIPDIHPKAFDLLLKYIYTEDAAFDKIEDAVHTVYASKKYMINKLTTASVEFILTSITIKNVCLVLEQCKSLDEDLIVTKCYEFICQNALQVISENTFTELSLTSLQHILNSDSILITEEKLVKGVINWGKRQLMKSGEGDVNDKMIEREIHQLKLLLRFPLLPYEKLLELKDKYSLLTSTDTEEIYEYQSGKLHPNKCKFNTKLRGVKKVTRFSLSLEFALLNLVRKDEIVKRKFYIDFWPLKANFTLLGINIMNGPYLVRVLVFDHMNQLISYTQRDFSKWTEAESCRETTLVLQEPVECDMAEEPHRIEVYLSKSKVMFWYDNVIVGKFSGNSDVKIRFCNPEIISKVLYLIP